MGNMRLNFTRILGREQIRHRFLCASSSLTPAPTQIFGTSFWALILTACGGGGGSGSGPVTNSSAPVAPSKMVEKSGFAYNRPLEGGTVWLDVNKNNKIDVSRELDILGEDISKFSHALRDFRNYIHPYQQMEQRFAPDKDTAKMCVQVMLAAINDLSKGGAK